jgi:hypothetical protein
MKATKGVTFQPIRDKLNTLLFNDYIKKLPSYNKLY